MLAPTTPAIFSSDYSVFESCHHEARKGMENPVAKKPATFMANTGFDFEMVKGMFLSSPSINCPMGIRLVLRPRAFRVVS